MIYGINETEKSSYTTGTMRKLAEIQVEAEKLSVEEQIELAQRLLDHARRARGGEEALLSEALLAKEWLREDEDQAWASL